jgi:hypothetical protein
MAVPDQLARFLIRAYPRAWRIRYVAEMRALIEARPGSWSQVFDLARACAGEWVAATQGPARSTISVRLIEAAVAWGVALAAGLAVWLAGGVLAVVLAALFRDSTPEPFGWLLMGNLALWARPALGLGVALSSRKPSVLRPRIGPRELWLWVAWMVVSSALHQWGRADADFIVLLNGLWFLLYWDGTVRAQKLAEALKQFDAATGDLTEARRQLWRLDRLKDRRLPVLPPEMDQALTHEMTCLHDVQRLRAAVRKLQYPW